MELSDEVVTNPTYLTYDKVSANLLDYSTALVCSVI